MLKARSIKKSYGKLPILKGVDLDVNAGEIVSIVGASGAGKSSLLNIIGTLDKPDSGKILLHDADTSVMNQKQFHHLLAEFNAIENICIPAYINGKTKLEAETRASELLEMLNLGHRKQHKPNQLSGGEQQRVAVARALINNPALILADEPSGNLDSKNAKELHQLFFSLRDQFGQTFIIVTHNEDLAEMSDRKVVMKDGLIEA